MRKRTLKYTMITAAAAAALCLCMSIVSADTPTEGQIGGWIEPSRHVEAGADHQNVNAADNLLMAESIPASYDLRDENAVTAVKNQGSTNACWTFSAIASIESNLVKTQGVSKSVDLSEGQLGYYTYVRTSATQPAGLENDTVTLGSEGYDFGGLNEYAISSVTRRVGAVTESAAPFSLFTGNSFTDNSLAFKKNAYVVKDVDVISMQDKDTIKKEIMNDGALSAGLYWNWNAYKSSTCSYYYSPDVTYSGTTGGHAVTIIGWDDNYDKSNFAAQPVNNGAWLCKNSWGTGFGNAGYYWISYEDKYLQMQEAASYQFTSTDNAYDNVYQYDGGLTSTYMLSPGYIANVFTADSAETLKAVSLYTEQYNIGYTITVYRHVSGAPGTGTPDTKSTAAGTIALCGYHTIPLSADVSLESGEKYAIVVRLTKDGSTGSAEVFFENRYGEDGLFSSVCTSKAGESYISSDGSSWKDCKTVYGDSLGNLRIKAFTDEGSSDTPADTPASSVVWKRLGGGDRYATAALIATEAFSKADEAILVSGENWPDALSAGSLAGIKKIPILITNKKSLNASTASLIKQLGVTKITIIGSTDAVSANVEKELVSKCGIAAASITRRGGKNRAETAESVYESEAGSVTSAACVVASGDTPADALSISPWTYYYGMPVFLTRSKQLSEKSVSYAKKFRTVYILGSDLSVDSSVDAALQTAGVTVKRLYGDSRYDTSVEIAKYFCGSSGYYDKAAFANGSTECFPDALCGAMLQGSFPAPMILVNTTYTAPFSFVKNYLSGASVTKLYVLGGTPSMSDAAVSKLKSALASS